MHKLISFLVPTRNRVSSLRESIISLITKANDPSCIEILLKVDNDDQQTIDTLPTLPYIENIKYIISDRKNGYQSIHEFQNDLYKISSGDWIMIFSDDALMVTQDYDLLFKPLPLIKPFAVFHNQYETTKDIFIFPCINRLWCQVQGDYFTTCLYTDGHIWYAAKELGNFKQLPIDIVHRVENHPLTIGRDQTLIDKEHFQLQDMGGSLQSGHSDTWDKCVSQIHLDYLKIKEYIDQNNL